MYSVLYIIRTLIHGINYKCINYTILIIKLNIILYSI